MFTKKHFSSTVLAGLFVTSCLLSPAIAQEQNLKPQGAWALTKVDRTAEGGNSYCTLSRKYDGGVVLSLARNQAEEYSLAIDFQKDVFKRDRSLKINLQPGPGQIRAYDMMPSSEKAVVIRLGWDTGFFDALDDSRQMQVKIDNNAYAFAMPEVTKGQKDLQNCMEDLQIAAQGGAAAPSKTTDVLMAEPVNGPKNFSAEKLETRLADAGAANGSAASAATKAAAAPAAVKGASAAAAMPGPAPLIPDARALINAPTDEEKQLLAQQEKAVLKDFADSMRAQEPSLQKTAAKAKTASASQEKPQKTAAKQTPPPQKPAVKAAAEPVRASSSPAVAPVAAANTGTKNAAPAKMAVAASPQAAIQSDRALQELQARLKTMAAENEGLKQKTADELGKSNQQITMLQSRLAELATENDSLRVQSGAVSPETQRQLNAIENERMELEERLFSAEQEKAKLSAQQVTLAGRTRELENRNAELEASLATARTQMAQAALEAENKSTQQVKNLQERLALIVAENEKLKTQSATIPETQKRLDAIAAEKKALEDNLKQTQAAAAEAARKAQEKAQAEQAAAAQQKALEEQVAALRAEAEAQTKAHAQVQAQLQEQASMAASSSGMTPLPDSMEEMEKLRQERDAMAQKVAALEQSLASIEPASGGAQDEEAAAKIQELEVRNAQLEENLKSAQTRIAETAVNAEGKALRLIADLEHKLESAQKDNMKLAKDLESLRTQKEDSRLTLVAGDWNLEQATKRFNEAEREIRRLGRQVENERMSCSHEKAEIEQMLFDPAVTEKRQIEKLQALEGELREAKAQLKERGIATSRLARNDTADGSIEVQALEPAAGHTADLGEMAWTSTSAPAVVAAAASSMTPPPAVKPAVNNAQAAVVQSQMNELRRQLARKENESATYRNQLIQMQRQQEAGSASGSAAATSAAAAKEAQTAQRLNTIQPASGGGAAYAAGAVAQKMTARPAAKPQAVQEASFQTGDIQTLLTRAGVPASGLKQSGAGSFSWAQGGAVQGSATVRKAGGKTFDAQVQDYIAARRASCSGDFASIPTAAENGAKNMALYEVACVGAGGQGQSSSIVFFEDKESFVAVASQSEAANLDEAMDSRDRIAGAVKGM